MLILLTASVHAAPSDAFNDPVAATSTDGQFVITADPESSEVEQGSSVVILLQIDNSGANDSFRVTIGGNLDTQTFINHARTSIAIDDESLLVITIYGDETDPGEYNVVITVHSDRGNSDATIRLNVEVKQASDDSDADLTYAVMVGFLIGLPLLAVILVIVILAWFIRDLTRKHYEIHEMLVIRRDGRLMLSSDSTDDLEKIQLSALFTAIQHFADDAFGRRGDTGRFPDDDLGFKELRYGSMTILIENRGKFYVAVIGSGEPDGIVRLEVSEFADDFEKRFGKKIRTWDGNTKAFKL